MSVVWLIAADGPRPWMLPLALTVTLGVQVAGYLAAMWLFRTVARRRKEKRHA